MEKQNIFIFWIGIILFIIVYLFLLNMIANSNYKKSITLENNNQFESGSDTNVGVQDQAEVQVRRDRWYGTIIESHATNSMSSLYLFNLIKFPLEVNGNKIYSFFNMLFLFALISSIALFCSWGFFDENNQKVYKDNKQLL